MVKKEMGVLSLAWDDRTNSKTEIKSNIRQHVSQSTQYSSLQLLQIAQPHGR